MDAITLGLDDDNLLATALLHDVEEDCGVNTEDLGFNDTITHSVHLLTKRKVPKDQKQSELNRYFHDLQTDKNAIIVKLLDRKNNLSTMVHAFSYEKDERVCNRNKNLLHSSFKNCPKISRLK